MVTIVARHRFNINGKLESAMRKLRKFTAQQDPVAVLAVDGAFMYRLDNVFYVAKNINHESIKCVLTVKRQQNMELDEQIMTFFDRAGLLLLARLNHHWFKVDEPLISAFVER
ncbi:hypothetical protein PIB30_016451 [Stylosanthes scabra]|uniref:Uncharacterized protein n=1 Tax=Stylosanthes scabra TaxID=79078 RepID=A0ABU6W5V9_9FABA|nr:hypothetical protein [Stylosanthes scabra]